MAAPELWVQFGPLQKQVSTEGCLDVGRWRKKVRAAFADEAPALARAPVSQLELQAKGAALTSGQKLAKLQAAGWGLSPVDAFHLSLSGGAAEGGAAFGGGAAAEAAAEAERAAAERCPPKGGRHAGYWCGRCSAHCSSPTAWKQHYEGRGHQEGKSNPWLRGTGPLADFPCRAGGTLEVGTKHSDLNEAQKELLRQYLALSFREETPLLSAFEVLLAEFGRHLRVKEVFETVEVWKKAVSHLQACNASRAHSGTSPVATLYEVASGHGLLAVLLAYRFPQLQVVAVDMEKREGFAHFVDVVNRFGEAVGEHESCLANLSFVESRFADFDSTDPAAAFICVHGCNELNMEVLARARQMRAAWLVVPCCLRRGLTELSVRCGDGAGACGDDTRHAVMCGIVAAQHHATAVLALDRRITNRHLVLQGDAADGDALS